MTAMIFIDPSMHLSSFPATYVAPGVLQNFGVSATAGSTTGTIPATAANFASYTYTLVAGNPLLDCDADALSGYFTATGALAVIPVGFVPTRIRVVNWTDGVVWEWMLGAPATDSLKQTNSTDVAVDTNSQILVTADSDGGLGNVTYVTLGATMCANAKVLSFRIEA